ncbi:MAG: hypothetical protein K0S71_2460 [Clostridia bacterium]|jgi:serine/threonine protein phosphatase PrpC|nr:hypothetical protein [Clostridia bacterium]
MEFHTYTYTNKGGRPHNEDNLGYEVSSEGGIWAVADGLGGHAYGEVASKIAVDTILSHFNANLILSKDNLEKSIQLANGNIVKEQKAKVQYAAIRTTIVAAISDNSQIMWANVGDTRLYYFRNGSLLHVTPDHTVSYKAYLANEIEYKHLRFHEDKSKLLRALGNGEACKIETVKAAIPIENGDAFLLCSDGFWEYIFETEMEIDLAKARSPKEWVQLMLLRHIRRAKPGNDNFSALAVLAL